MTTRNPVTIRLKEPRVEGQTVHFAWESDGDRGFYLRPGFQIDFPDAVPLAEVPDAIWLRVMLICLHNHWALLRPCRIELPRALGEEEHEFWQRMIDAAVSTLENDRDADGEESFARRTRRQVELLSAGPPAHDLPPAAISDRSKIVCAFSGGRDSLVQLASMRELGRTPLLVNVTSARAGSQEFATDRYERVLRESAERTGAEMLRVGSDLRSCFDNSHPTAARCRLAVSEVTDTLLYFACAWVAAWVRGAPQILLASEAEAQENLNREGTVVQIEHFAYSGVTQRVLSALIEPTRIRYDSATSALEHFQIQRLLDLRFTDLRDLQYSCYSQKPGQQVCSACYSCFKASLHKISDGCAPSEIGLDVDAVLVANRDWTPTGEGDGENRSSVGRLYGDRMNGHLVRVLRSIDESDVDRLTPRRRLSRDASRALAQLKETAARADDPPPEPGYRQGFLELLDRPLAEGLDGIYSEHFEPAPPASYSDMLENAELLSEWIAAPLSRVSPQALQPAG